MLTVFILANHDAKALGRTLNALISASVDGLVREVLVVAEDTNDVASKLADDAGCNLVHPSQFPSVLKAAKGEWLMILQAGSLPEHGWAEAVGNHIESGGQTVRFTRSPLSPRNFIERLFKAEQPLALGLLIEKAVVLKLDQAVLSSAEILASATKPKTMPAALRPASNAHPDAA